MPNRLKAGFSGIRPSDYGKGPGGNTTPPIWQTTVRACEPNDLLTLIAQAELYDYTVFLNIAGARQGWTDSVNGQLIYNNDKYRQKLDRWTVAGGASQTVADALTAGLLSRRLIAYVVDEPFIAVFGGSIPKSVQNNMGLMHKARWNCITAIRSPYRFMKPAPTGGWTGIDYGWAQLDVADHEDNSGLSPAEFYAAEKAEFLALDLGMIPGGNWLNSGDGRLWDHDQNPATPDQRVQGDGGEIPGRVQGLESTTNRKWLSPPQYLREIADAIYDDPDAGGFNMYHDANNAFIDPMWLTYQLRADFVAAFDYMINKFNTRPVWNGWRTAKGTTPPPPPPPPSSGVNAYVELTERQTFTHTAFDTVPGAELDDDELVAGNSYLILVSAQLDYSATGFNSGCRVLHGATEFDRSEFSWSRPAGTRRANYFFWTVWTAVATEDISFQVGQEAGRTDIIGVDQISMVAIDLSSLPAGSVQYDEDLSSTALNGTYAAGASVTFTPGTTGQDWLVLTHAQYTTPSTSQALSSRLLSSGGLVVSEPEVRAEGRDAALDIPILHTASVRELTNVSHTFSEESKNSGGGGPRVGSAVLALNLSAFTAHAYAYVAADLAYIEGTPKFGTLAQSTQLTIAEQADVWVFGFHSIFHDGLGVGVKSRLQTNNTDTPDTQTVDDYGQQYSNDLTDVLPLALQSVVSLAAGTHQIDLDASVTAGATLPVGRSRLVVGLQLGAPPTANETPVWDHVQAQSVTEGETLTFTVSATDAEDDEVDLSYTVVSELPENAQFDSTTRTFVWTPQLEQAGEYELTLRVEDLDGATADIIIPITVIDVPSPLDYKELRSLRYDHNLQGGRLDLVITWNGAGNALKQQGVTGIEVEYTDLGRI